MIKIGILGAIGSGKSFVARNFGHPVFNADDEVSKLYKKDKKTFYKLKKKLPKYICSFPINKNQVSKAIIANKSNLKKIIKVVHQEIRRKLKLFIKKNKEKKIIILDIPLLLENKMNNKKDILVFVDSKRTDIDIVIASTYVKDFQGYESEANDHGFSFIENHPKFMHIEIIVSKKKKPMRS